MNTYPKINEKFYRDLLCEIGARIQAKRTENKISVQELATMLGVSREKIYKVESGNGFLDYKDLFLLGRTLSVSVDYLLYGEKAAINDYLNPDGVFSRLDYKETKQMEAEAEMRYPEKAGDHPALTWMMSHTFDLG